MANNPQIIQEIPIPTLSPSLAIHFKTLKSVILLQDYDELKSGCCVDCISEQKNLLFWKLSIFFLKCMAFVCS